MCVNKIKLLIKLQKEAFLKRFLDSLMLHAEHIPTCALFSVVSLLSYQSPLFPLTILCVLMWIL